MTVSFELMPPGGTVHKGTDIPLTWPTDSDEVFETDLGWDLAVLGVQRPESADLLRIAMAAYLADRRTTRGETTWTRNLRLRVPVSDTRLWTGLAGERLVDLLWWLTGDVWELEPLVGEVFTPSALSLPGAHSVYLLSGGLDSLCGAVLKKPARAPALFLGHAGTENVVRKSQSEVFTWVQGIHPSSANARISIAPRKSAEPTSRTRSLLFMALGIAAAIDGGTLHVPENGFTSVNLALMPGRAGACSTRSTHPSTFRQVNAALVAAGIPVTVTNPHAQQTKGEMVRAAERRAKDFGPVAAETISCSKLNGYTYKGGNANRHCGLCVACVVRRAAFLAADVADGTVYLIDSLPKKSRAELVRERRSDIHAIKYATSVIPSRRAVQDRLIAAATWDNDAERHAAADIYLKGLKELANVPLP